MHELTIENQQKIWRIKRPSNLEELWNNIGEDDFGDDERLPYWVEIWPSSLVLARWLVKHAERIRGEFCLDVGCGLGFTSLVAAHEGAHVIAMDYEKEALGYAHENFLANEVKSEPLWVVADWRHPAFSPEAFPLMWAGDIMYEKRFIEPVARFIHHCLSPNGCMWIAEPNRPIYHDFMIFCKTNGLLCTQCEQTQALALEGHKVTVNMWEIRKK